MYVLNKLRGFVCKHLCIIVIIPFCESSNQLCAIWVLQTFHFQYQDQSYRHSQGRHYYHPIKVPEIKIVYYILVFEVSVIAMFKQCFIVLFQMAEGL